MLRLLLLRLLLLLLLLLLLYGALCKKEEGQISHMPARIFNFGVESADVFVLFLHLNTHPEI